VVLHASATSPRIDWTPSADYLSPDCDPTGSAKMPLPLGGALEGEAGYSCVGGGDCHLLVVDDANKKLFEMYAANYDGTKLTTSCLVTWDLEKAYSGNIRGENCVSTMASGLPKTALSFSADEVAAGEITHAIGVVLPSAAVRAKVYGRLASNGSLMGGSTGAPFGTLLRLRGDFPVDGLPTEGARVVARALQRYGMIVMDLGGIFSLTAQDDRFTTHKWAGVLSPLDLTTLGIGNFDVVDTGPWVPPTGSCIRKP
jgi:serine/threonine-protein kinase